MESLISFNGTIDIGMIWMAIDMSITAICYMFPAICIAWAIGKAVSLFPVLPMVLLLDVGLNIEVAEEDQHDHHVAHEQVLTP